MNKLFLLSLSFSLCADHAITYEFSGGRFGDNLLSYLHAKWLSYRYGIPVLVKKFKYSSELALQGLEPPLELSVYKTHIRTDVKNIANEVHSSQPLLFICPYFPEDLIERHEENYYFFDVDWKDEEFRKVALAAISPTKNLRLIEPSKDTINIAIHVRDGENYDDDGFRIRFPLKLPPFSFYLEAFPKVVELFRDKQIYCHIFTDVQQPQRLVEAFKKVIPPGISIKFGFRRGINLQNINVLEDFFSLFNFDVILRPQSHFSLIPSLLHDFAVECYPSNFTRAEGLWPKLTETALHINEEKYQELLREK